MEKQILMIIRFIWFFITLLSVSTTPAVLSDQQDELFYSGFKGIGAKDISLDGIAEIEKKGVLRLTNHTSRLIGHAFYPSPFQFKTSNNGSAFSFSTSFAFAIVPEYTKLGGHGFAFTIAPSKELRGAHPSQYLGLLNATDVGKSFNHLVAIEFDTVQDFEFGDINDNHVGIDINSMASNASATAAYFTDDTSAIKHELNLKSGKKIKAWVDYDSVRNLLNVTVSPFSAKPRKPLLSFKIDLSPILLQSMYVGFSASTGLLASSHYLLGWSFKMNGEARNLDLSSLPSLPGPKKSNTALVVGVSTAAATLLLVIAIFIAVYLVRKFKNRDVIEAWEIDIGPHRFSYKELKRATKGFRDKELIGFGGFGKVYKGTLPKTKTQVAVKRINHESKQGIREFVSEIATIGRLRHRNLVQLQGWCRRQSDLLLVYDYMANGSLDSYLFDDPKWILSWEQRFKIIKGVASGLLYLHEEWEQIVIHRDIKASNVLIDNELNGRLGDFGLARLCDHGANPSTTRVVGTLGYLAPELTRTGKGTTSSDVFAFGALLLEVVCGRRPIEPKAAPEELILVDWVWEKWREGLILDAVDSRLEGKFNEEEVLLVIKLGLMCSSHEPTVRPTMRQVVRYLEGEVKAPEVLNAPGQYETPSRHNEEAMADFLYSSYPSSFGGASAKSFNGYGDGDADTPPSRPRAGSPLSLPLW